MRTRILNKSLNKSTIKLGLLVSAALAMSAGLAQAATKIYKTIDADGNVVYTDVAPARRESDAQLQVEELNTFSAPPTPEPELPVVVLSDDEKPEETQDFPAYTAISIAAPGNDAPVRANNGNISLQASVTPTLHKSHQLRFYLDGKPVGTVNGLSIALEHVDRGTHQTKVEILDSNGSTLLSSSVTTFHLLRHSILNRNFN